MMEAALKSASLEPYRRVVVVWVRDGGILIALWTIQVVTLLFVIVSVSVLLALVSSVLHDVAGVRIVGVAFLAMLLIISLCAELGFYVRNSMSVMTYMLLQTAKAGFWATFLCLLLDAASGLVHAGIPVFREAAWKLL